LWAVLRADEHVVFGVPRHVQRLLGDFDSADPLDAVCTEPSGRHDPSRISVIRREYLAVHGQRDQGVLGKRLGQRHGTAGTEFVERGMT
jgi:hypothetical protein